jgi:hypothetical protein
MRTPVQALMVAVLSSAPVAALAGPSISLNGVSIDGVTNQRFENCDVVIDGQGNVHIEAKGYTVRIASAAPQLQPPRAPPQGAPAEPGAGEGAPSAEAALTRRYFLVTEQSQPGGAQYDIAVFINSRWIRDLKSTEEQVVTEITKYLHSGPNRVVFAATKRAGPGRGGSSKDATFKVVLGEGSRTGDEVAIENPLLEVVRRASETEDVTEEKNLLAR